MYQYTYIYICRRCKLSTFKLKFSMSSDELSMSKSWFSMLKLKFSVQSNLAFTVQTKGFDDIHIYICIIKLLFPNAQLHASMFRSRFSTCKSAFPTLKSTFRFSRPGVRRPNPSFQLSNSRFGFRCSQPGLEK